MQELNGYAIWIVPEGEVYKKLQKIILQISKKYGTPSFEPHISLYGLLDTKLAEKEIICKTLELVKLIKPFKIHLFGLQYLDEYFRCLFVRVESESILDAYDKADKIFRVNQGREFLPHMSLMYGDLPAKTKEKIIKDMGNIDVKFLTDKIRLYRIKGKPDEWKMIREFSL